LQDQSKRKFGPKTYLLTLTPNRRKETHMTTITRYTKGFVRYLRNNSAVSALEYAILVGIIAVAISLAVVQFGADITTAMKTISGKVATTTINGGVVK
jgi:Flp pilus assembly pilin Flp